MIGAACLCAAFALIVGGVLAGERRATKWARVTHEGISEDDA